jgi:hypothetical protein
MTNHLADQGYNQAIIDWNNKNAAYLITGRLDPNKPILSKNQVFYPRFYFARTVEDEEFCQAYNNTIHTLIKQEGIPDWSAVKRIPEKITVLEILTNAGQHISTYKYNSIRERNLVQSVLHKWEKTQPLIWSRFPEKQLIFLGGDISPEKGRVDILDVEHMGWLATFELCRKNNLQMPWDKLNQKIGHYQE